MRLTVLPPGIDYLRRLHLDHDDTAALVYYQAGAEDLATEARVQLLQRVVKGPFFYLLRTRDQLGYVVYASPQTALRRPGLKFVVQSPSRDMAQLRRRVETFLREEFPPLLDALGEEEFEQYREGLINDILEKDNSLSARSHRYFKMLALKYYDFDYQRRLADAVRSITKADLQAFYRQWIQEAGGGRLIIEAYGRTAGDEPPPAPGETQLIEDIEAFKARMPSSALPEM